jgi:hypothetical protein
MDTVIMKIMVWHILEWYLLFSHDLCILVELLGQNSQIRKSQIGPRSHACPIFNGGSLLERNFPGLVLLELVKNILQIYKIYF